MKFLTVLFALLLSTTAYAAEQSLPPMSQNATTPAGNGYQFVPSAGPEGGGRWTRTTPHPAATIDTQVQAQPQPQAGNPFADPQYMQQQAADPAQVTAAPPADINADAPEVAAPRMTNRAPATQTYDPPAERDPNPPIVSTGGGSWSLPQAELDAMAGRAPSTPGQAPAQQPQPQQPVASGMQSFSVTSVEKCLAQLPPAEAMEVRTRFVKPYEECQNRVGALTQKQKTVEAGKQAEALAPETPRNYIRVAVPQEAPAAKDNSTTGETGKAGNSFIDITGSSRAKVNP